MHMSFILFYFVISWSYYSVLFVYERFKQVKHIQFDRNNKPDYGRSYVYRYSSSYSIIKFVGLSRFIMILT